MDVNLVNKLNFPKHISNVCERVHNQIQVIIRLRSIFSSSTAWLYKARYGISAVVLGILENSKQGRKFAASLEKSILLKLCS